MTKRDAAKILGSHGGKVGGKARTRAMTPEQRKASASRAARARWAQRATAASNAPELCPG